MLALRGIDVDLEADFIVIEIEVDDAAVPGEIFQLADGRHAALSPGRAQDLRDVFFFRFTDEQQVAGLEFLQMRRSLDRQLTPLDGFVLKGLLQDCSEWILSKYAHTDGRLRLGEGRRRPFDEL